MPAPGTGGGRVGGRGAGIDEKKEIASLDPKMTPWWVKIASIDPKMTPWWVKIASLDPKMTPRGVENFSFDLSPVSSHRHAVVAIRKSLMS